ncbi:MAG: ribbon-helix-helix protein, CopG family [Mesorhizobium sp.]|nr:MAG: ribbon-helix-helix protein, CopG family [Mesorhizobium sp.]
MSTSIRLSQEVWQRLDALASRTGRSKAYHLREFIERGLEDIEDYYLAAEVLARIRSGEEDAMKADDFWCDDVYR